MIIQLCDEELELLPDPAIYWRRENALLITDTHFGKAATFRNAGIPVPEQTTATDLARLSTLLAFTSAKKLFILGDLLHAKAGRRPQVLDAILAWRTNHASIDVILIRGNHDRASGVTPAEWRIEEHISFSRGPFLFTHEPTEADKYVLSGHIHPSVSISDGLHKRVRLPCFMFGARQGILPAFGSFTGTYDLKPEPNDRVYVIADQEVIQIPFR